MVDQTRDTHAVHSETFSKPSLLEWLVQRGLRLKVPPLLFSIILALLLSLIAGLIAVRLSRNYYAVAAYHFDSAAYRLQSIEIYETYRTQGLSAAIARSLGAKDGLDITLRVIFAPSYLLHPYGHMTVLLIFMSFFIFLTIWYVFNRTKSLLLGLSVILFIFTLRMMYNPLGGIADYWKDNISTWLLSGAVITWLLSENLGKYRWSLLSGLLLGLLIMQRTAAAVYAIILFAPVCVYALYYNIRFSGWRKGIQNVLCFAIPVLCIGIIVVLAQWQALYSYYFVTAYSYGNIASTTRYIASGIRYHIGFICLIFGTLYFILFTSIKNWRDVRSEIITASWFVCGFPMIVIVTSAEYNGFFSSWSILLIVLLAVLFAHTPLTAMFKGFTFIFLIVSIPLSVLQYVLTTDESQLYAQVNAKNRILYQKLIDIIILQPQPYRYALLFDEVDALFLNHAFFNNNVLLQPSVAFVTVHDSYYRGRFTDIRAQPIIESNIKLLEEYEGTLAVGYCDPQDTLKQSNFQTKDSVLAREVTIAMSAHLLSSPHWKVMNRLDSPYGCLYVSQYTVRSLSEVEKWQEVSFYNTLNEIPLTISVGQDVRLYQYKSRFPPEQMNGGYYQWLPSGDSGLQIVLFSDRPREVTLQTQVIARKANQELIISQGDQRTTFRIDGQQDIAIPLILQPGLNPITLAVKEASEGGVSAPTDPQERVLLLVSPHLIAGTEK